MTPFVPPVLMAALPEMVLAGFSMILLLLGVAAQKNNFRLITRSAVLALICVGVILVPYFKASGVSFGGMFIADNFAAYMKTLVIAGTAASLAMSIKYMEREKIGVSEYPVLMLFSTLGMMLMISANDLISLYMGLELQSLPLYVLAAIQRDGTRSTEAGLKYFILGALSSGLLLYGASLIYGFTGATNFHAIAQALSGLHPVPVGVVTGMVLMTAGLAFKISGVPFHMWAPDVYEGAPTSVTAFFAIVPKVAALALIIRVFTVPFAEIDSMWIQVILFISIASMALGAFAAIVQTNIKRLLAYSSIGHMGYALVGLCAADTGGIQAMIVYVTIYMVMSTGVFSLVLMMKRNNVMVEKVSDLAGLAKQQPALAFAMALLMFSMAGIPPLAGFFGKLFIFQSAVKSGFYILSVFGVLTSVIAAYYYLRIIKIMYFDETHQPLDTADSKTLKMVLTAVSLIIVLFIVKPQPLLTAAETAAASLKQ